MILKIPLGQIHLALRTGHHGDLTETRNKAWEDRSTQGKAGLHGRQSQHVFQTVLDSGFHAVDSVAWVQALQRALAAGLEKEGELATASLEFEFHLQFLCGSPSTDLSDFRQSARSGNERKCKQILKNMCHYYCHLRQSASRLKFSDADIHPYSGTLIPNYYFVVELGFRIPRAEFRIPMPSVPHSSSKNSPDSGDRNYLKWGGVYKWVYLRWIYMDFTWQPVTFSAELSSGVSRMELTNKTCNILETLKKKKKNGSGLEAWTLTL